jgi:hypothetical protein
MNISLQQQRMWTTMCEDGVRSVDNCGLSTSTKTTQLQDVTVRLGVCEVATVGVIGKHTLYPQSTGLITVISSSYKHPHLTINNVKQGSRP